MLLKKKISNEKEKGTNSLYGNRRDKTLVEADVQQQARRNNVALGKVNEVEGQ